MMDTEREIENTLHQVPGEHQVEVQENTLLEGCADGAPRIMFLGNSITYHPPKPEIGWFGKWGMAASSIEKDYVHLIEKDVLAIRPNAAFCIVQAATWERGLDKCDYDGDFSAARDFAPDIVYFALGGNTPLEGFDEALFRREIAHLLSFVTEKSANPRFLIATNYYAGEKSETIRAFANEKGYPLVDLTDSLTPSEHRAVGLFWHEGVAGHPGDEGMRFIADAVWQKLKELL